ISNAVGMAMAERFLAERFNRPGLRVVDHHTYAICSDGDMMEGVSQEAASIAGHFRLGKLIVCYDDNHITIDGTTSISFDTEDHPARMRANGWHVQQVADAEDLQALEDALQAAGAQARWQERFEAWRAALPEQAAEWDRVWAGELYEGWREALPNFDASEEIATRSASQEAMAAFAPFTPTMIGGAADLVESTKTVFEGGGEFSGVHVGRNV